MILHWFLTIAKVSWNVLNMARDSTSKAICSFRKVMLFDAWMLFTIWKNSKKKIETLNMDRCVSEMYIQVASIWVSTLLQCSFLILLLQFQLTTIVEYLVTTGAPTIRDTISITVSATMIMQWTPPLVGESHHEVSPKRHAFTAEKCQQKRKDHVL